MGKKIKLLLIMGGMRYIHPPINGESTPQVDNSVNKEDKTRNSKEFIQENLEHLGYYVEDPQQLKNGIIM